MLTTELHYILHLNLARVKSANYLFKTVLPLVSKIARKRRLWILLQMIMSEKL